MGVTGIFGSHINSPSIEEALVWTLLALGATYFQGHSLDIVWRFENASRVMLNSVFSARVIRSFLSCLVFMGLGLLGMLKMDPGAASSQKKPGECGSR